MGGKLRVLIIIAVSDIIIFRCYVCSVIRMKNMIAFIGDTGMHRNKREVIRRFRIDPGYYIIIPSSRYANKKFEFLFRIFTEQSIETRYFNFLLMN